MSIRIHLELIRIHVKRIRISEPENLQSQTPNKKQTFVRNLNNDLKHLKELLA